MDTQAWNALKQLSDTWPAGGINEEGGRMLSHKNTAFMLDHLLDLASSIKLLRSISMHNWAHSRLDAKGQPAITLIAPPESVYLKSIKSLKTEPHPSLVALGVSDRAPAEEEFETTACGCRFDKTLPAVLTDIWTYQQLRWINGCAETIAEYDEACKAEDQTSLRDWWKHVRGPYWADVMCIFLACAEHLEQLHYVQMIRWRSAPTIVDSKGDVIALAPPKPPFTLRFLDAFKASARVAFPMLGIKVEAAEE